MNIVITGGAGFIGTLLAESLLKNNDVNKITLVDIQESKLIGTDPRLESINIDMTLPHNVDQVITDKVTHVFHLAAIVSSHAEEDFDLGMSVNLETTQLLLEKCRHTNPAIRFVFSSSLAVFGGTLPDEILPMTAMQPVSSYGTQKAIGELLVNDYARKGYVDAVTVRLPTICIRPGKPNKAASSFVSGIIREPLNGLESNCPVDPELKLWISSPNKVVENIARAGFISTQELNQLSFRTLNLPGFQVTPSEMIANMNAVVGKDLSHYISFEADAQINRIVSSWPQCINNDIEKTLGFVADSDFTEVLAHFLNTENKETEATL
ncbi:D-erythronate dehydrogenase [Photobacterium rosenbergii]|uniref:SDR family oxidoreductase n=1 Tax=Photobacterium rosenbergii TaxID=294936 RepID=A0ABU3ZCF4_9GAMM|nr:D-erythronate dehydrogenase [Photobacterium rosenbergii]MDV5167795.1 SDR family oxidoreductase [Photobacterium rosenbergii]